jgi:hypothetical protein
MSEIASLRAELQAQNQLLQLILETQREHTAVLTGRFTRLADEIAAGFAGLTDGVTGFAGFRAEFAKVHEGIAAINSRLDRIPAEKLRPKSATN